MSKGNQKLYLKLFISLVLCIVLTLLVTSSILYINFENIVLKQVYSNNLNTLLQTGRGVASMTKMATTVSNQIYRDLNVARLLYYSDPEVVDLRRADEQLTNYRLSLPFIDSVYVYNEKKEIFYINAIFSRNILRETIQNKKDFDDKYVIDLIDNFKNYKPFLPIPRKYIIDDIEEITKYYYSFLLYEAFSRDKIGSAVIVNISAEWITNFISNNIDNKNSSTFIINKVGTAVSNSGMYSMMTDLAENSYIKNIINSNSSGYFIDDVEGEKYLITYTEEDESGWRYVNLTSWNYIFQKIEKMIKYTLFIGLGIFLIGIPVSFVLSKRLYIPIDNLMNNVKRLLAEKKKNTDILRRGFLRDLLLGRGLYDEEKIQIKFEELGLGFNAYGYFTVLLIKIDNYNLFSQEHSAEDRVLLKSVIMKIIMDILPGRYKLEILDMGNDGITALMNFPSNSIEMTGNVIRDKLTKIKKSVSDHFNISISITVSSIVKSVSGLSQTYHQVVESSLYRLFYGYGCLIYAEDTSKLKQNGYEYPFQKEKLLISSLMAGKTDETRHFYDDIISSTLKYPINVFNLAISRLTFTVSDAVNTIYKNNSLVSDPGINMFSVKINKAEVLEDINSQFYYLFEGINTILCEKKKNKHEILIFNINEYIEKEFSNPDLYIESIAEFLNKAPTYISHLYKQHTMMTILDKIIKVRMDCARELLVETPLSISEIAAKTGFASSSYFFKVFKKINGATPSSFRKNFTKVNSTGIM